MRVASFLIWIGLGALAVFLTLRLGGSTSGYLLLATVAIPVVFAIGAAVFYYFTPEAAAQRKCLSMDVTPIGKVRDRSLVRIAGKAVAPATLLTSPVGKQACIAFTLSAEFLYDDGEQRMNSRVSVEVQREGLGFTVANDTDEADVELTAQTALLFGASTEYEAKGETMARFQKERPDMRLGYFVEVVLLPGASVTVCGRGSWETAAAGGFAGYRDVKRRLRVAPPSEAQPVVIIWKD